MQLLGLPNELLSVICDYLDEDLINSLHQTCKRLYSSLGPTLYRRDATSYPPRSLEWAAIHGFETTTRCALNAGISPIASCFEGKVPVELACIHGHEPVVRLMLDEGADPKSDHYRWHYSREGPKIKDLVKEAAFHGHESVCKALLNCGVQIHLEQRWNIVKAAIFETSEGRLPIIKLLVEPFQESPDFEEGAESVLSYAAVKGYCEVVRYLLEMGVRVKPNRSWDNALIRASREGHLEVVQLLLSNFEGTPLQIQDDIFEASYNAADANKPAVCEFLRGHLDTASIIAKGKPGSPRIVKLFATAAMCGWTNILQQLLDLGCSPDMTFERDFNWGQRFGWTALVVAAMRGHLGIVEQLLAHNADPNLPAIHSGLGPDWGDTGRATRDVPIVVAATQGYIHIVKKLLEHGANPNPKTTTQKKRFAYDDVKSPEIMSLLLDWGADPSIKWKRGRSLLSDNLKYGSVEMVKMLFARETPLEMPLRYNDVQCPTPNHIPHATKSVQRDTLFTLAAQNGAPMVELLLEQGYKVEPGSDEVGIAYDYAFSHADEPLVNLLSDRGLLSGMVETPAAN